MFDKVFCDRLPDGRCGWRVAACLLKQIEDIIAISASLLLIKNMERSGPIMERIHNWISELSLKPNDTDRHGASSCVGAFMKVRCRIEER